MTVDHLVAIITPSTAFIVAVVGLLKELRRGGLLRILRSWWSGLKPKPTSTEGAATPLPAPSPRPVLVFVSILALGLAAAAFFIAFRHAGLAVIAQGGGDKFPYETPINLSQPGVLFITAQTSGSHHDKGCPPVRLSVEARLDDKLLAVNEESQPSGCNITLRATASSAKSIAVGSHRLKVKVDDTGITGNPTFSVDWFVIGTRPVQ